MHKWKLLSFIITEIKIVKGYKTLSFKIQMFKTKVLVVIENIDQNDLWKCYIMKYFKSKRYLSLFVVFIFIVFLKQMHFSLYVYYSIKNDS